MDQSNLDLEPHDTHFGGGLCDAEGEGWIEWYKFGITRGRECLTELGGTAGWGMGYGDGPSDEEGDGHGDGFGHGRGAIGGGEWHY